MLCEFAQMQKFKRKQLILACWCLKHPTSQQHIVSQHQTMDDILALQKQLAAVQLGGAVNRLSERNCVEIVTKLQDMGLLQLVFTRSGKEYLTPNQLRNEIEDEILARGGRLNVTDLPNILNVDLHHISNSIEKIMQESEGTVLLVQGDVLTDYYLDSVSEEINEILQESPDGYLSLADLASRFSLPIDLLKDTVTNSIGTLIQGKLEQTHIYTSAFISRSEAKARGVILGSLLPTTSADIMKAHNIKSNIVSSVLKDLISSGVLKGNQSGKGERAMYTPSVFTSTCEQVIRAFYSTNGYVDYDRVSKMMITNPAAYLKGLYPDGLALTDVMVGEAIISQIENAALHAIESSSWFDVNEITSLQFSENDIKLLMGALTKSPENENLGGKTKKNMKVTDSEIQKNSVLVSNQFLVSTALVKRCTECLRVQAEKEAINMVKHSSQVTKTSGGLKSRQSANVVEKDDKKTKNKKKRAKEKEKEGSTATKNPSVEEINIPDIDKITEILERDSEIQTMLSGNGELESYDEVLARVIEELLVAEVAGIYHNEYTKANEKLAMLERAQEEQFYRDTESAIQKLEFFKRNIESVSKEVLHMDEETFHKVRGDMEEYLIATQGYSLLYKIIKRSAENAGYVVEEPLEQPENWEAQTKNMVKKLPGSETKFKAQRLIDSLSSVSSFLRTYDDLQIELDLPLHRLLDKKKEKSLNASLEHEFREGLKKEKDPVMGLRKLVIFTMCQVKEIPLLEISSKNIPKFINTVQESASIDAEAKNLVCQYHSQIVEFLKNGESLDTDQKRETMENLKKSYQVTCESMLAKFA